MEVSATEEKRCGTCRKTKPIEAFNRYTSKPNGRERRCRTCSADKDRKRYRKYSESERQRARDYRAKNPDKSRAASSNWKRNHPEQCRLKASSFYKKLRETNPQEASRRARKAKLKAKYGITPEQEEQLIREQEGKCAICHKVPPDRLHIDHDHKTGKVRAGLCSHCNRGLGCVHEDIGILTEMIIYLIKHSQGGVSCLVEE